MRTIGLIGAAALAATLAGCGGDEIVTVDDPGAAVSDAVAEMLDAYPSDDYAISVTTELSAENIGSVESFTTLNPDGSSDYSVETDIAGAPSTLMRCGPGDNSLAERCAISIDGNTWFSGPDTIFAEIAAARENLRVEELPEGDFSNSEAVQQGESLQVTSAADGVTQVLTISPAAGTFTITSSVGDGEMGGGSTMINVSFVKPEEVALPTDVQPLPQQVAEQLAQLTP